LKNTDFNIGNVRFSNDRTVIIAEAGVNHLGDMGYAEKLISAAARSGADIIKFQTYKAEKLTTKDAPRFWNWEGEPIAEGTQFDSYSALDAFGINEYIALKALCDKYKIEFMSTPFDNDSVDLLVTVGVNGFKIASCDLTNYPLLTYIANKHLPILLSTGAANIAEIREAIGSIRSVTEAPILIMHCTLCYPTEIKDANLLAVNNIRDNFPDTLIGLSDHTLGILVPTTSVALGVRAIEKHFTFDKTLPKSADHWLSLDESELTELVQNVRNVEKAMGSGVKELLEVEKLAWANARRSIVAGVDIAKGKRVAQEDFLIKRPGTGMNSRDIGIIIGKRAVEDIKADTLVKMEMFED
jgi:N,N'-diacetyllegionaminate synthase